MACEHPKDKVRFIKPASELEYPGLWVCADCNLKFTYDPTGESPVKYTQGPAVEKVIHIKASKH